MPIETPSDRDFACFFCLEGKTRDIDGNCPRCGKPIGVGVLMEGLTLASYRLVKYIDRGFYGATFRAANRIGKPVALKIVPAKLYDLHGKSFSEELDHYARLGSHPNIADLYDAGTAVVSINGDPVEVHFVVMEWIDGVTLTKFIANEKLDANIVYGAALDIASGISRFEEKNLWHNDLNSDNILVKRLTVEEIRIRRSSSPFILKIVDTGSAVFRQAFEHRRVDDLTFLGHHAHVRTHLLAIHGQPLFKTTY